MNETKDPARSFAARPTFTRGIALAAVAFFVSTNAAATLTVAPLTWNVVGLDSNDVNAGPNRFPVGARVCSDIATTNVAVNFVFDSANTNVNLRPGSLSTINFASIGAGGCMDAYFEAEVTRTPAAYDTTRRYHITATDLSGTVSTATPRELYVEHLISQNRNSITDVKYGPVGPPPVSVPPGGSMSLVVGNTYTIELDGGTATQGYNQFEAFINFANTVFQILNVSTTYSADNSPYVPNPNSKLYADACLWQNDPNAPTYRSCVGGDFKAGGSNVVTTYTIKIIGGGGTSQTLNTLLYDFSGSSYHYNSDFSSGARIGAIIDPTTSTIAKSFNPSTTSVNGVSALTITIGNPNPGAVSGYNFVDNLPANLVVATPNGASTAGCGTPTLTATAGSGSITFSNGTVAANSSCVITVNVTPTATGMLTNTTNNLFVGTTDTTHNAAAILTVNNAPMPPACTPGLELARWTMETGQGTTAPPMPSYKSPRVATATALYTTGNGGTQAIDTVTGNPVNSWSATGWAPNATGFPSATTAPFMDFTLDTTNFTNVAISEQAFIASGNWAAPANNFLYIYTNANGGAFSPAIVNWNLPKGSWNTIPGAPVPATATGSSTTTFRTNAVGAKTFTDPLYLDNIIFTGCGVPAFPTLAKAFSPNPIAVGATSTLTFTLTNANSVALTNASFTDTLPSGVQVAVTPAAATTCGGTWTPAAGNTTLTFSGGVIPATGSCTVQVNVTATTGGPHQNVSGYISTTETGTNTGTGGSGSSSLTAILPPSIAKLFDPSPITAGGVSTLTFSILNPNVSDAISGVAFADTFPVAPGAMVVAATPNATTTGCGAPTFAPVAGAGSIAFTGGSIAAGGTCVVTVDVTVPVAGTYNNTSGNVSHIVNGTPVNGNTASGSLVANPPNPSIHVLKQIGLSMTGPWMNFVAVTAGTGVYYQFTVENTGDVPLGPPVTISDNMVNVSTCNAMFASTTLPVAVAANNNHIVTCVVGPVVTTSGSHTNTASAASTFMGQPVNSPNSTATYATTGLSLAKSVLQSSFMNVGDMLNYSYLVTNTGSAPLQGPVTVTDDKATVSCPAVNTVGDLDDFLDPGEMITCTATYVITMTDFMNGFVTNTATAHVQGVDSNSDMKTVPKAVPVELQTFEVE